MNAAESPSIYLTTDAATPMSGEDASLYNYCTCDGESYGCMYMRFSGWSAADFNGRVRVFFRFVDEACDAGYVDTSYCTVNNESYSLHGVLQCDNCPSCFDGVQNDYEAGVDCGGPSCARACFAPLPESLQPLPDASSGFVEFLPLASTVFSGSGVTLNTPPLPARPHWAVQKGGFVQFDRGTSVKASQYTIMIDISLNLATADNSVNADYPLLWSNLDRPDQRIYVGRPFEDDNSFYACSVAQGCFLSDLRLRHNWFYRIVVTFNNSGDYKTLFVNGVPWDGGNGAASVKLT